MVRSAVADRDTVLGCLEAIESAYERLEQCSFDALSAQELIGVLARREVLSWRAPVVDHRILARLSVEGDAGELGACSLVKTLAERLRISTAAVRRRLGEAAELGPRTALGGEPLEPLLPELAAAQAAGRIGPEQLAIARRALAKIPAGVSAADRQRAEVDLAVLAGEFTPEMFARLADHLVAVLNPDGDFTDRERQAHRGLRLGRQGLDGMSTLTGRITPELRATLEPILAKLAAPGMCNAADEKPCVSGTPSEEQIRGDDRRPDQRNHDALLAASRAVLSCKGPGAAQRATGHRHRHHHAGRTAGCRPPGSRGPTGTAEPGDREGTYRRGNSATDERLAAHGRPRLSLPVAVRWARPRAVAGPGQTDRLG